MIHDVPVAVALSASLEVLCAGVTCCLAHSLCGWLVLMGSPWLPSLGQWPLADFLLCGGICLPTSTLKLLSPALMPLLHRVTILVLKLML